MLRSALHQLAHVAVAVALATAAGCASPTESAVTGQAVVSGPSTAPVDDVVFERTTEPTARDEGATANVSAAATTSTTLPTTTPPAGTPAEAFDLTPTRCCSAHRSKVERSQPSDSARRVTAGCWSSASSTATRTPGTRSSMFS